jgi:preprotein translocase subunit YajC
VQSLKALSLIFVTLLVNDILHDDDLHRLQQPVPPLVLQIAGHTVVVGRASTLYVLIVPAFHKLMHVKGQLKKALSPKVVTLSGIVTDVSAVHDSKASIPITVTLVGITTDVNSVHDLKALLAILVVSLVKVMEHGDDVHRLQQPLPSLLLQTRTVHVVVTGRAPTATDLVTLVSQLVMQENGS